MVAAARLKTRINQGQLTTGILVTNHLWLELVEICLNADLDYMIVDNEHGAFSPELVADVCAAGRLADLAVLLRPISHDMSTIRKSIDMGPCGLLLPNVNSAAVLDQVRDAVYMPPRGQRRPGGRGNRWVGDYSYDTWKTEVEDNLIILPQIETREGLANVTQIASHELTTAMAIGPYDLSVDLGVAGQTSGPEVTAATQTIQRAAYAAGKKMWVIGDGPVLIEQGFSFLCIAEPTGLLERTLKQMVLGLHASGGLSEAGIESN